MTYLKLLSLCGGGWTAPETTLHEPSCFAGDSPAHSLLCQGKFNSLLHRGFRWDTGLREASANIGSLKFQKVDRKNFPMKDYKKIQN